MAGCDGASRCCGERWLLSRRGNGARIRDGRGTGRALRRTAGRDAMRDGAFGVASALIYPPGSYAGTAELIEIARAMSPFHGTYITHMRSEDDSLLEATDEAMRIGREGGVPVIL